MDKPIPEAVRLAIHSNDLYQVLMDVQNGIDSPGLCGMANSAIRRIDSARNALTAAQQQGQAVAWWNPDAEFSDPFSQSQTRKHRIALYTAPPSAPVGVDAPPGDCTAGEWLDFCTGNSMAEVAHALAQQPAAPDISSGHYGSSSGHKQPAAVNEVRIPRALAGRVMTALGKFTSDESWSMVDMETADDFGAAIATQHQEPTT